MKISWINNMYKENLNTSGQHRIVGGNYTAVTAGGVFQKVALKRYSCGEFDFEFHMVPLIARLTLYFNNKEIAGNIFKMGYAEYNRRMTGFEQKEPPHLPSVFPPNQYDDAFALPTRIEQIPEAIEHCRNVLKMINSDFAQINGPLDCCNYSASYGALFEEFARRERLIKRNDPYEEITYPKEGRFFRGKDGYICTCMYFRMYEEALRYIRGWREWRRTSAEVDFEFTGDKEKYENDIKENNESYTDVEPLILAGDDAACDEILRQNYLFNRDLLQKYLKFEIPEDWREVFKPIHDPAEAREIFKHPDFQLWPPIEC